MQERVGVRDLAAFACAGLAGCWYVLPRFAAQLDPFQAKLGRNCGQRHDLQDAGRIGSPPAETQSPKAAQAARSSLPRTIKEGRG